jgi:hypothetical protein
MERHMALEATAHLTAANTEELARSLRKIHTHGANVVIGWYLAANGIKVLHLPSYSLSMTPGFSAHTLTREKFVKKESDFHRLSKMGAKVTNVPLSFDISNDTSTISAIDRLMRQFSITYYPLRCVALFDMAGYSKYEPFEKITLITMLSHHITVAADKCRQLELPVDIHMTSTGDGFYVWNERVGMGADVALYTVAMLALIYNHAALGVARNAAVPNLRCCLSFGEHFEYFQHRPGTRNPQALIVGDITLELARMMSEAVDNQILMGSHQRRGKEGRVVDTPRFVKLAQSGLDRLGGMQIPGGKIAGARGYLTGERDVGGVGAGSGIRPACFNTKLDVTTDSGTESQIGCLDSDLEGFSDLPPEGTTTGSDAKSLQPATA